MTFEYDIRRLVCVAAVVIVSTSDGLAQTYMPFGRISEIPIGGNFRGMIQGDFNGDKKSDLVVYGSSQFALLHNFWNFGSKQTSFFRISEEILAAVSSDLNEDGKSDLVLLVSDPLKLKIFMGRRDTLLLQGSYMIPSDADHMVIEDMNNDRKPDVVLFGKKSLGITVLLGNGDGTFGPPQKFLEDYSLSAVIPCDLNADRLEDLVAFDWVKNEILVFSGVGRLRFATPSSIFVPAELSDIVTIHIDKDENLDLAVIQQEPPELRTYLGDGLDNFSPSLTIPLSFAPSKVLGEDLNGDKMTDLIVYSNSGKNFSVFFNNGDDSYKGITYSAGTGPEELAVINGFKGNSPNIAILDKMRQSILLYHSVFDVVPFDTDQTYALGLDPRELCTFDVDNDKDRDILVINNRSENISVLLNRGNGTFYGQLSIPIDPHGESILPVRKNDSTFVLLTTHPEDEKIVLTKVRCPDFSLGHYPISTGRSPDILDVSYDAKTGRISVLVSEKEGSSNSVTISEIQELEQEKFFEKSLFFDPEKLVLAANVVDMNHDGIRDIVYLARDPTSSKSSLYLVMGRKGDTFSEPHQCATFPDTGIRDARIWKANLNDDGIPDLMVQFHSDDDYLVLIMGKNDSSFTPIHQRFSQVAIRNRQDVSWADIDGDGKNDLILVNDLTKTVQVFLSKKGGGLSPPKRLVSFPGGGSCIVSDFDNDGIPDYAVVYSESGMLKVFLGKE